MTSLTLAIFGLLIVISPGADFALVLKNSMTYGRKAGIRTSLGISLAISMHIAYSLFGISYLISQNQWLFSCIRYAGAAYLIYLGIKGLYEKVHQPHSENKAPDIRLHRAFWQGFICNGMNPKTMMFFLSIFSQLLTADQVYTQEALLYGVYLMVLHGVWFCIVALFVTTPKIQNLIWRFSHPVQRLTSLGLIGFGTLLAIRQ